MKQKLFMFGAVLLLASGCSYAKKDDVEALRAEMAQTRQTANQALETAREARQMADESTTISRNTVEIVNRGFKTSMRK